MINIVVEVSSGVWWHLQFVQFEVRFEVLMLVNINIMDLEIWHSGVWSVGTNILRDFFRVEEGEGRRAAHSSKMLIPLYQSTLCHIQEDCNFSLKSSSSYQFLILHTYLFNHSAWKVIYIIQHTVSHLLHFNMIVLLLFRTQIFNVLYDPRTFRGLWSVVLVLDSTSFHCC